MDLLHDPELKDDGSAECSRCHIEIPLDLFLTADQIVDLGGAGIHLLPRFAHGSKTVDCTAVGQKVKLGGIIVCPDCQGEGYDCPACKGEGVVTHKGEPVVVEQAEPQAGEVIEVLPPISNFEKRVTRQAAGTFQAMREATRLVEPEG